MDSFLDRWTPLSCSDKHTAVSITATINLQIITQICLVTVWLVTVHLPKADSTNHQWFKPLNGRFPLRMELQKHKERQKIMKGIAGTLVITHFQRIKQPNVLISRAYWFQLIQTKGCASQSPKIIAATLWVNLRIQSILKK